jgi:myosin-1
MQSVGIQEAEVQSILGVVAAILHLGNVDFVTAEGEGNQEGSAVSDYSYNSLSMFCRILQLDENTVAYVLTNRELQTTRFGKVESSYTSMNPVQAADRRDSLSRSLYEKLFNMIVGRINAELDPDLAKYEEEVVSIGVLDIYGFEIFERNGFEQLSINYVNEKLQQIFIELTLRAEQDEYAREGIKWTPIPFFNNHIARRTDADRKSTRCRIGQCCDTLSNHWRSARISRNDCSAKSKPRFPCRC